MIDNSNYVIDNLALTATVASNALTVTVVGSNGSTPSQNNRCAIAMRSATATSGAYNLRYVTSALSLVVPSTATLGTTSAVASYLFVYALDNGGTVELAISSTLFDTTVVQSTTTIAGGSNTSSVMYSATGRSNVPVRLIGKLLSTQTVAGTWAAVPSQITLNPVVKDPVNYAVSSSTGTFNTTSGSYVAVTNASVTLVTTGRPVEIRFIADGTLNTSAFSVQATASVAALLGFLKIQRDGVDLDQNLIQFNFPTAASTLVASLPYGSITFFDPTVPAGAHTYALQAFANTSNSISVTRVKMMAIER